jgi:hypothetical protein
VSTYDNDTYSVHFARFAAKLETHLLRHGVSCADADMIIEESSVLYFEKLNSTMKKFFKLIKKQDPAKVFVDSAYKAIEKYIPNAKESFGSYNEISNCIR